MSLASGRMLKFIRQIQHKYASGRLNRIILSKLTSRALEDGPRIITALLSKGIERLLKMRQTLLRKSVVCSQEKDCSRHVVSVARMSYLVVQTMGTLETYTVYHIKQ